MLWQIDKKLKLVSRKAVPDKEFIRSLETRLRLELGLKSTPFPVWKIAISGALVLLVILSGTGVYAYTSPDVLPDTPLYSVRITLENIEEKTAITTKVRTEIAIKHLERRIKENEIMEQKQKPISDERVKLFTNEFQQAMDKADDLPEFQKKTTDELLDKLEKKHEDVVLKPKKDTIESDVKKRLEDTVKNERVKIKNKIEKMDVKRQEHFKDLRKR